MCCAKMHIITFVIGDWSDDGHGKTRELLFQSNLSKIEVENAYVEGTKLINFDFSEKVAVEYQNPELPAKYLKILNDFGAKLHPKLEDLDYESFADIWMFIAKLGRPDLEIKMLNKNSIDIGGYGLFY